MGMSRKVVVLLLLLLAGNALLLVLNQRYAAEVAQAQLEQAMQAESQRAELVPVAPEVVSPRVLSRKKDQSSKRDLGNKLVNSPEKPTLVCRFFGPYERAVNAALLVNQLQQAGATVDFIDLNNATELPETQLLRLKVGKGSSEIERYWVRAEQKGLLQGARPEDLSKSISCD